jgi:hypothetical protein
MAPASGGCPSPGQRLAGGALAILSRKPRAHPVGMAPPSCKWSLSPRAAVVLIAGCCRSPQPWDDPGQGDALQPTRLHRLLRWPAEQQPQRRPVGLRPARWRLDQHRRPHLVAVVQSPMRATAQAAAEPIALQRSGGLLASCDPCRGIAASLALGQFWNSGPGRELLLAAPGCCRSRGAAAADHQSLLGAGPQSPWLPGRSREQRGPPAAATAAHGCLLRAGAGAALATTGRAGQASGR